MLKIRNDVNDLRSEVSKITSAMSEMSDTSKAMMTALGMKEL